MSNPIDPFTLGLLLLFGGAAAGLLLGGLVGWITHFTWGLACGLLCTGLCGLGGAGQMAWFVARGSAVAENARVVRCEEHAVGTGRDPFVRILHLQASAGDGRVLALRLPFVTGRCSQVEVAQEPPVRVRYALKDAASATAGILSGIAPEIDAEREDDPRSAWAGVGVLGTFGGFTLLAGLFFGVLARREGQPSPVVEGAAARPDTRPLAAWRQRMGGGLMTAGNLAMLTGAVVAGISQAPTELVLARLFGTLAAACAIYLVAFALLGRLRAEVALALLIVGGGCGMAAWAVAAMS